MRTSRLFCIVLMLILPCLSFAQVSAGPSSIIPPRVKVVLEGHRLPSSSYSFYVQEVGSSSPLLAINADRLMNPASAIKTITTYSALASLGPAYTWSTKVYALGSINNGTLQGDLLLEGSGDPFLVEEQLRALLKVLQRNGIRKITGNLILDGSYYDPSVALAERIDNQGGRSYNTLPSAVLANFQAVTFYFEPHSNGRDVLISADPHLPNLKIDNRLQLRTGACTGYQRGISFDVNDNDSAEVIFSGRFPQACTQYQMTREVLDASTYTFGLFKILWQQLGGEFEGELIRGKVPDDIEPLMTWDSSPLSDVIKSINKFSNNLMTRHLLLTLGAEKYGPPARVDKGVQAVLEFLESEQLDSTQLKMVNGAGLARDVEVSTRLMTEVLQLAWRSPYMPEFLASLPINGMDGTMRTRLRGRMTGHMHIKTGTLDEVSAIAGFVLAQSGKMYTVTSILNHELADRGPGTELSDALLRWVYSQ